MADTEKDETKRAQKKAAELITTASNQTKDRAAATEAALKLTAQVVSATLITRR